MLGHWSHVSCFYWFKRLIAELICHRNLQTMFLTYKSNAVQALREMAELRVMTLPDYINITSAFWGCQVTESLAETKVWIDKLQSQGFRLALNPQAFRVDELQDASIRC